MGQFNLHAEIQQILDIASTLVHPNPHEAIRLAQQAAARAETLGHGDLATAASLIQLMAYRALPSTLPDIIEQAALQTITLAQTHQQDEAWIEAMNTYADVLYGTNQFDGAMDYWLRLLEVGIDRDQPYAKAVAYIGLGKLFYTFEDPQSSLAYFEKARLALDLTERIEPRVCLLINLAACAYHRRQYTEANHYLDLAENWVKDLAFCEYEPEIYYYRGYLCRAAGQLDEACQMLKRALMRNAYTSNIWLRAVTMMGLGEIYLDLNLPHKAQYFMQQALDVMMATPNIYRYLVMQAHEGLARCYQATGQTEQEFKHWTAHFDLSDALLNHGVNQRLARFKCHSLLQRVQELETLPC